MRPAQAPRDRPLAERLLVIRRAEGSVGHHTVADLPSLLAPGDLLVLNDAGTVPASLAARAPGGEPVEVRLCGQLGACRRIHAGKQGDAGVAGFRCAARLAGREANPPAAVLGGHRFRAALLGAGDWRTPTEHRPPPPPLALGDPLAFPDGVRATVERIDARSPRLVDLAFSVDGAALWRFLFWHGRPVQYAHLQRPLDLWSVQTGFAGAPWAFEMPSAGRPLTWALLEALAARGVHLASVTEAAGLSSTGDPAIDAALPLSERFAVSEAAARAIDAARDRGGRVIAVGTSVVRALESAASAVAGTGRVRPYAGSTDLLVTERYVPRVCDGLFTGLHEPAASHFRLLAAFAPRPLLERAYAEAEREGYLGHEFGDSNLIL